jgi:hypothetical protein
MIRGYGFQPQRFGWKPQPRQVPQPRNSRNRVAELKRSCTASNRPVGLLLPLIW